MAFDEISPEPADEDSQTKSSPLEHLETKGESVNLRWRFGGGCDSCENLILICIQRCEDHRQTLCSHADHKACKWDSCESETAIDKGRLVCERRMALERANNMSSVCPPRIKVVRITHPSGGRSIRWSTEPTSHDDVLAEDVCETFVAGRSDVIEFGNETMFDPVDYHL